MDQATCHKAQKTKNEFAKLGLSVLFNAPGTPELNPCEDFIRDVKAKLNVYQDSKG